MKEFVVDSSRERILLKQVRRGTKRWRIGLGVSGFFLVVLLVLEWYVWQKAVSVHETDIFPLLLVAGLFPGIGLMLSLIVAMSGGKDILGSRIGEKIYFTEGALVESYAPRYPAVESASLVEHEIPYQEIREIRHNRRLGRYLIRGHIRTVKQGLSPANRAQVTDNPTGELVFYDCYENMPELLAEIQSRSMKIIKEE